MGVALAYASKGSSPGDCKQHATENTTVASICIQSMHLKGYKMDYAFFFPYCFSSSKAAGTMKPFLLLVYIHSLP